MPNMHCSLDCFSKDSVWLLKWVISQRLYALPSSCKIFDNLINIWSLYDGNQNFLEISIFHSAVQHKYNPPPHRSIYLSIYCIIKLAWRLFETVKKSVGNLHTSTPMSNTSHRGPLATFTECQRSRKGGWSEWHKVTFWKKTTPELWLYKVLIH